MSGVNAHAIFGPAEGQQAGPPPSPGPLQRLRHWPNPVLRHLVGAAKCTRSAATFAADLLAPPLAFLADHKVHSELVTCFHCVLHNLETVPVCGLKCISDLRFCPLWWQCRPQLHYLPSLV